ncbi:MAG: flotillin family protein [Bacteroidales bacterium]|nr:flotillin family protein [Bacteroidales bacterium]
MEGVFTSVMVIAVLILVIIAWFVKRYKRCPSDKILVVYGKVGKGKLGDKTAKCIHGGGAFIWPVIQDYNYLDLTPISINVDLRNALSKQQIRVNVPCIFTIGINSSETTIMTNAAERLLGLPMDNIRDLAHNIIVGQLRSVIATMDIEEINADRITFAQKVSDAVDVELRKLGLNLINVNITDITDESNYIANLGEEAAAKANKEAQVKIAEQKRLGAIDIAEHEKVQRIETAAKLAEAQIGEAEALKNQRVEIALKNSKAIEGENEAKITIANSEAARQIGEAEASTNQRVEIAQKNSKAIEGENAAKITIANSEAARRKAEAEATKLAVSAEKINEAQTLKESYTAQKEAEIARAEREKASKEADIIVPAEIERKRIEIEAEAEAEKIRRIAKGNADSIYYEMEAKAKGMMEILQKQADGFNALVKSAGNDSDAAVKLMIANKITDIVKMQTEAVQNLKIDKVTVWDSMNNGKSSTANFLSGMLGSLPPLNDVLKSAGINMPGYLGKEIKEEENSNKTNENLNATTEKTTEE